MEALTKIDNGKCHLCQKDTNNLAGNPSLWPIWLPFVGGNGATRCYHTQCVILSIDAAEKAKLDLGKFLGDLIHD